MRTALLVMCSCTLAAVAGARDLGHCPNQAPREARAEAAGTTVLRVVAKAGVLRIDGRPGATAVLVKGTACASSAELLAGIQISTERSGSRLEVRAEVPDTSSWLDGHASLDLALEVPAELELEVEDGSGAVHIRNVAAVSVRDGSGDLTLETVAGEARITDGSGGITVRDAGSVTIDEDGSGSISIAGVRGDVVIRDDGSGGITVRDVGGDFTVDADGSGAISHQAVKGRVRVPSRH